MSGIFAAAAFILLDVTVANELTPFAYHFSPITLAQLTSLVGMNARLGVTLRYAAMFFGCGIPALALINIAMARRKIK